MDTLSQLLSSRVRAEIFRLLFGLKERELHVRNLARQAGLNEASIRQEMKKLSRLDLVSGRRDGNRVYHRANTAHPLYPEIHRLVLKTSGLVALVQESLCGADVELAFIFGSVAEGRITATSDVDLMVLGSISLRQLITRLGGVTEAVGRDINPHVMTKREYRKRMSAADHFVTNVLHGAKLFVIGTEDDLAAVAQ